MTTRNRGTRRAKTQFTSEELVAEGFAMKDSTGAYSELILLYEEPGAKGWSFCGKARLDARGNEFPCLRKKGKGTVLVTDVSVVSESGEAFVTLAMLAKAVTATAKATLIATIS